MLDKILFPKATKAKRKQRQRSCDRERHFEALYMQSFTEMRARSHKD
ncbi:hypothetical protein [Qipengyuania sp.]